MLYVALTFFTLGNVLCRSLSNYPLGIILIAFSITRVSIISLVYETILVT